MAVSICRRSDYRVPFLLVVLLTANLWMLVLIRNQVANTNQMLAYLPTTNVSVLITPNLVAGGLGSMLACSAAGALWSIRTLYSIDPGEAFRT